MCTLRLSPPPILLTLKTLTQATVGKRYVVLKVTTRARARSLTVSVWSPGAVKGVRSDSDLNDVPMLKVVSFSVRVARPLF